MSSKHPTVRRGYRVRSMRGLRRFDIEAVGRALDAIVQRDGGIQASVVVEEARAENSPLHEPFEWDDGVAGEAYRLWQARQLVRNVVPVVYERGREQEAEEVPFVHVPASGAVPPQWRPRSDLEHDSEMFARAYEHALGKLRVAQRSVSELEAITQRAGHDERIDVIRIAMRGLETAQTALERLH